MIDEKVICAGFSGQGVMSIGQLLAYGGMAESLEVSWVPSYGPEMRGGTANCSVMISESPIGSPLVDRDATSIIVMNSPSLQKFESQLIPGGSAFINSSLVDRTAERSDITAFYIPANEMAYELGNAKFSNMIMLGSYIAVRHPISLDSVKLCLSKVFHDCKASTMELNTVALDRGYEYVKRH